MPKRIEELAKTILKNPIVVKLAINKPADKIKQLACVCHENQKLGVLKDIFKKYGTHRVIVFSSSKQKVKDINRSLISHGINSGEMHSDLSQSQRDEIMYSFKTGKTDILIATDIVARGIDIDDISMVINFDVPHDTEDYVHRIGRTARADNDGIAITLVRGREIAKFMEIERFIGHEVEKLPLPKGLGKAPEYKVEERRSQKEIKGRKHFHNKHKRFNQKQSGKKAKESHKQSRD